MVIGGSDIEGENLFLRTLGEALTAWQAVEQEAYMLFVALMGEADSKLVSIVFHHIQSFESRASLLDRCAYFAVQDTKLAERWDSLRKRLNKSAQIRNRLVHFAPGYQHSAEFKGYLIGPSHLDATYAIKDRWKNPDLTMDQTQLAEASYDFESLATDLATFCGDIRAMPKKTSRNKSARSRGSKSEKHSK